MTEPASTPAPTPAPAPAHPSAPADLLRAANDAAPRTIFSPVRTPAETFRDLARAAEDFGLATGASSDWDMYDQGGAVELLERQVRELLGTEDAAFFPSGILAQQAALRVHADTAGSRRVAIPDLSHLLIHEEDGPRLLHGFRFEPLTHGAQTPTADALDAIPGRLGAVLVELPLREPGCLLPTWEALAGLSDAAHERGVPLHIDGARLWESLPWLGHTAAEVAALADTVYVSFYKGLGGLAGSVLAGRRDVVEETRLWRRRAGGTIYRQTAEALSALVGLRDLLPGIPARVAWARAFAEQVMLAAGTSLDEGGAGALPRPGVGRLAIRPGVPQTNQFLVYAQGDPDDLDRRTAWLTEDAGVAFCKPWRAADEPGRSWTEVAVGTGALAAGAAGVPPQEAADLLVRAVAEQD